MLQTLCMSHHAPHKNQVIETNMCSKATARLVVWSLQISWFGLSIWVTPLTYSYRIWTGYDFIDGSQKLPKPTCSSSRIWSGSLTNFTNLSFRCATWRIHFFYIGLHRFITHVDLFILLTCLHLGHIRAYIAAIESTAGSWNKMQPCTPTPELFEDEKPRRSPDAFSEAFGIQLNDVGP